MGAAERDFQCSDFRNMAERVIHQWKLLTTPVSSRETTSSIHTASSRTSYEGCVWSSVTKGLRLSSYSHSPTTLNKITAHCTGQQHAKTVFNRGGDSNKKEIIHWQSIVVYIGMLSARATIGVDPHICEAPSSHLRSCLPKNWLNCTPTCSVAMLVL